jgi:glycosyltransferase involved in cell wall biosynthesis
VRILYLHQYFATPKSNAGTRSFEIAKRLVGNGHQVIFVTSSAYLSKDYDLVGGWNFIEISGIKLYVLKSNYSNKDAFVLRMMKFLSFSIRAIFKSLTIKSDVVLATSTPLTIAIPGLIYSKLKSVPLVFEVRDLWPELPIATGVIKNKLLILFASWLERYTYKNSKRLIGLSPGMCEGIRKHGIDSSLITLATNSCDTDLFDVNKSVGISYLNDKLSFVGDRKLVVYTGTFGLINDVSYIVELAKVAKDIDPSLCFLAIGEGMQKESVTEKAINNGVLNNNLYILPAVPKSEIVQLLSAASLSLSLFGPVKEMWKNSANKLFDSLASQTPVAINYSGWQKDFILEHECGLVLDSNNFEMSVNQISTFLNDNARYEKALLSCKDLSYNQFSRDLMANRVEMALKGAVYD